MNVPILYDKANNDYSTLGLGLLKEASNVFATRKRNNFPFLEFTYPIFGILFSQLEKGKKVVVDVGPGTRSKRQRFEIVRITKPQNGIVSVYCEHIALITEKTALNKGQKHTAISAQEALNQWRALLVPQRDFTVFTDLTTVTAMDFSEVGHFESAAEALGGKEGSILQKYNGEYIFDNNEIRLMREGGKETGVVIAYGKNLVDLVQEESIESTYTSIRPYAQANEEGASELVLPEVILDSSHVDKFPERRVQTVDLSSRNPQTVAELRQFAQYYISSNQVGLPRVNLKVKFADLYSATGGEQHRQLEQLELYDTVTVAFNKLGVNVNAKINQTVWNVLLDKYESIELGDSRATLGSNQKEQDRDREEQVNRPPIIGPGNIANVRPGTITNLVAYGGFSQVILHWDMQGLTVREYEIYGSQEKGFVPGPSNLLGKTNVNAYTHGTETKLQWYYRVRAVNHHDVAGPFSDEIYGQTANTKELDELEGILDDLNDRILPELDERLTENDQILYELKENILPDLEGRLKDLEVEMDILTTVKLPGLEQKLIDNELALNELNNVSLPLLDERLKSAEQNFLDAQKRIDDAMSDIREVEDLLSDWQWEDTVEIDGGKIRANTIQALSIVAGSITTTQIRAGSIVGNDLAINTITAREINVQTITANELASDSIMTRHIRTNAVTANEIAARTITATEISAGTITGTQIAADTIRGSHIFAGTITATEISSGAITAVKIASNAVTTVKLDAEAVTAAKIAANTITAAQIAANTITANEIRAQTIVGDSIASNAIIARHITANSIVAGKIASGAVTTAKLAAGAVTATTIAARAVSADKLATNAIQVGFNSMGNSLRLTPTSLAFWQSTTVRFMEMTGTRLEFFTGQSTAIGGFERSSISGRTCVAYFARNSYSLVLGRIVNSTGSSEQRVPVMEVRGNTAAIQMHANINMNNWSITNQSDIRLKENIEQTSVEGIKETKRIRMVDFDWKQNYRPIDKDNPPSTARQFGMIAQEVPFLQAKVDGDNNYLSIDFNKQVNLNTKTNQELIAIVERQEQRIQKLEREMEKTA
ncbi:phage tail spike protein [Enterococcus entomosocium]|uniref:phage tail spike protein n=1 Tax=Enterococcus entomosocium TaxID=3034352 RepID=UPI002647A532|nr:phage tail spike protein [Enterococcus entomosocium]